MRKETVNKDRARAWAWLVCRGIRQVEIQRALQLKYITQVNETMRGSRNDRRVLQYIIDLGCPREYLDLPTDM
jgi:hypothetical protein